VRARGGRVSRCVALSGVGAESDGEVAGGVCDKGRGLML
jgi:hypothetical protein